MSRPVRVELPTLPEVKQRYLTHEQLHRLVVASGRLRTFVLVLGYFADCDSARPAALHIGDVDLKARRMRVSRSVTYVRGKALIEGSTKNHSARTVPVPRLVPLLATETQGSDGRALVFPSRRNSYLTVGEVRWVFDSAVRTVRAATIAQRRKEVDAAGHAATPEFPVITPHDLRHTCASLAISAGAKVKVLQTLLGHKTATLTLDRYAHLFPDDLGRIADAFDAASITADGLRTISPLRAVTSEAKVV